MILGVGAVLGIGALVRRHYAPPSESGHRVAPLLGVVVYVCIFAGLFLVVGIADAWDTVTLPWYLRSREILLGQGCSTDALNATYQSIQMAQQWLRGLGFGLAFGSAILWLSWRLLGDVVRQRTAAGRTDNGG